MQLTHDQHHVQRIQAVVSGGTLYLFWSHQDISGQLFYQTTTDLSNWSSPVVVGQAIGPQAAFTTANFGISLLASGAWILGWLNTSPVDENPGSTNNLNYPTVHVATSSDLASWSSPVELNLPFSQRWPKSVTFALDPSSGQIEAAIDRYTYPWDHYISIRTSSDGASWGSETNIAYDRSLPADGWQGYTGDYQAIIPGAMVLLNSVGVAGGDVTPSYGQYAGAYSGRAVSLVDLQSPAQAYLMPYGDYLPMADCATGQCAEVGYPVNALTGAESAGSVDLQFPAIGLPLTVSRTYTSTDGLAGQDSAFGIGWHWSYGVTARTFTDGSVAIVEASGRQAMFWKQGSGWAPAAYVNATLTAAPGGGYVLTRQDQSVWTFDSAGHLVSIADRNGNTQTLSYTNGVLSRISAPGGRSLTLTTDANGHITQISGPGGLGTSYSYDANGNLATATDSAGAVTTYSYDSQHELLTVVDGNHHTVETNVYGSLGRVTQQTDANNQVTTFSYATVTYAGGSSANTVTDPRGNQLRFFFDASWRMTERQVFQGSTTKLQDIHYSYDANGDLTQLTDGNGVVTSASYDSHGNLLSQTVDTGTGKLNLTSSFTYDSLNDLLSATDPLNHTFSYSYDSHGNRLTVTNALNQTTSFSYDGLGELTSVTDATNRTTSYGYDSAGDLTTITEPGNRVTTLGYDAAGRLTSTTDPLNHTTSFSYNGRGQLLGLTNALN